jgi:hypothetical protein
MIPDYKLQHELATLPELRSDGEILHFQYSEPYSGMIFKVNRWDLIQRKINKLLGK